MTRPTLAEIRRAAAEIHGMTDDEIRSRSRSARLVDARQDAWTVSREAGYSYPQISSTWGVDHSTVIHAIKCRLPRSGAAEVIRDISERAMEMAQDRKLADRARAERFAERIAK